MSKRKRNKAFTLAELLVVMAIIAVLAVISVLVLSHSLEKSREASDLSNLRSAKAAAAAMYLDDNENSGTYFYDAEKGVLIATDSTHTTAESLSIHGYGQGTAKRGGDETFYMSEGRRYTNDLAVEGKVIKVVIADSVNAGDEATISLSWEDEDGSNSVVGTEIAGSNSEQGGELGGGEEPASVTYTIISGANQSVSIGDSPAFTSNADFSRFVGVKIDGSMIDSDNYDAESGSTIVTLHPAYVAGLDAGEHTLSIVSTDGEAETSFTIEGESGAPASTTFSVTIDGVEYSAELDDDTPGSTSTLGLVSANSTTLLTKRGEYLASEGSSMSTDPHTDETWVYVSGSPDTPVCDASGAPVRPTTANGFVNGGTYFTMVPPLNGDTGSFDFMTMENYGCWDDTRTYPIN